MFRLLLSTALVAVFISGCTTLRETSPTQTAREQLLLSTAADQASARIRPNLPPGSKIFIDASNFGADSDAAKEYHKEYAISEIEAALLKRGYKIVGDPDNADTVVSIRSGALSINNKSQLIGIPSITLPIPFSGPVQTPELALWKSKKRTGIAKFGLSFYNAKSGGLEDAAGPVYGFSHYDQYTVLFFGWTHSNLLPPRAKEQEKYKKKTRSGGS